MSVQVFENRVRARHKLLRLPLSAAGGGAVELQPHNIVIVRIYCTGGDELRTPRLE